MMGRMFGYLAQSLLAIWWASRLRAAAGVPSSAWPTESEAACAAEACPAVPSNALLQHSARLGVALGIDKVGLSSEQRSLICHLKSRVPLQKYLSNLTGITSFSNCAVVSSSGALTAHRRGAEIDNHSAVFRFNDAPIEGYEEVVGTTDTVRFLTPVAYKLFTRSFGDDAARKIPFFIWLSNAGETRSMVPSELADRYLFVDRAPFLQLRDVLMNLFAPRWRAMGLPGVSLLPTSGSVGLLLALTMCNSTDTYDMVASEAGANARYHYFKELEETKGIKGGANDNDFHILFEEEHELWARISSTPRDVAFKTGKATFPGFASISCDNNEPPPQTIL